MSKPGAEEEQPVQRTLGRSLLALSCLIWMLSGFLVPGWLWLNAPHLPSAQQMLLALGLTVTSIACTRVEFSFGQREISVSPYAQPLLIGAVVLEPRLTMVIGALAIIIADWGLDSHRVLFFNAGNTSIAYGIAAYITHGLFEIPPTGQSLVLAAVAVSVVGEVVHGMAFGAFLEYRHPGEAASFFRDAVAITIFQVMLTGIVVAFVVPFVGGPFWALVFGGMQVITFVGLKVANSEQLERKKGQHMRDTFSRYIPEALVDEQLEHMTTVELGGEQREISVLFADIRGFTTWSEDKSAEEIITELNVLLTELSAAVMATEGTLDKYTGDGLMAFWGAPIPQEDHASRAVRAALDMTRRLDAVNERRAADGQDPFRIGIGVHTGYAVVGNVGHEKRLDYTAIGDTVNTTARLEAATKDIGSMVCISAESHIRLGDDLRERCILVGPVSVKGRKAPVEVYAVRPEMLASVGAEHAALHLDGDPTAEFVGATDGVAGEETVDFDDFFGMDSTAEAGGNAPADGAGDVAA